MYNWSDIYIRSLSAFWAFLSAIYQDVGYGKHLVYVSWHKVGNTETGNRQCQMLVNPMIEREKTENGLEMKTTAFHWLLTEGSS